MSAMEREVFAEHLGDALNHLDDHAWLGGSPLAGLLLPGEHTSARGEQLSQLLVAGIKRLKPQGSQSAGSPEWRQYRHLLMRHALGASPKEIAQALNVSERQARRDPPDAPQALGSLRSRRYRP